jgi:hypothetical protein
MGPGARRERTGFSITERWLSLTLHWRSLESKIHREIREIREIRELDFSLISQISL